MVLDRHIEEEKRVRCVPRFKKILDDLIIVVIAHVIAVVHIAVVFVNLLHSLHAREGIHLENIFRQNVLDEGEVFKAEIGVRLFAVPAADVIRMEGRRVVALLTQRPRHRWRAAMDVRRIGHSAARQKTLGVAGEHFVFCAGGAAATDRNLQRAANGVLLEAVEKWQHFLVRLEAIADRLQIGKGFVHDHDDVRLFFCRRVIIFTGEHIVGFVAFRRNAVVYEQSADDVRHLIGAVIFRPLWIHVAQVQTKRQPVAVFFVALLLVPVGDGETMRRQIRAAEKRRNCAQHDENRQCAQRHLPAHAPQIGAAKLIAHAHQ